MRKLALFGVVLAAVGAALGAVLWGPGPSRGGAADHLDAPGLTPPGGDPRLDLTDIYAFRAPQNPKNTVLVLNVNPLSKPGVPATFATATPQVAGDQTTSYYLRIDNNGNAIADANIRVRFGEPDANGVQPFDVRVGKATLISIKKGRTTPFGQSPVIVKGGSGIRAFAGMRDDPFFFDLQGFLNVLNPDKTFCKAPSDTFANTNVSSIVLELPSRLLMAGDSTKFGVWATTNRGGVQVDREGRPAIASVFIPNNPIEPKGTEPQQKDAFNAAKPKDDQASFRGEIVDSLATLFSLNDSAGDDKSDDAGKISGLADALLPDILTIDVSKPSGFLNGRTLADDVIDAELNLATEGAIKTDCANGNDVPFSGTFPFLAQAH